MRIALVAPLYETVPPKLYGGTERVISALADDLTSRGHEVTLFAAGGSSTEASLFEASAEPLRMTMSRIELEQVAPHLHLRMLAEVYGRAAEFDVIHAHTDLWTLPFISSSTTPTVITMHGRLDLDVIEAVFPMYPSTPLVSISDSQRLPVEHLGLNWVGTCYNGLDLARYRSTQTRPDDHLLFVGRITPEKRPDWAIEVAKRAGRKLVIAAKIDPLDQDYWSDVIEPLVDADPNVTFIGEVSEEDKPELFASATATLFPIDWPEPFGLVMIESMAAGTPVIALNRGSVPEVLDHGTTGLICQDLDEMVAAVVVATLLDRVKVSEGAARFSAEAMGASYLGVYKSLLGDAAAEDVIELSAAPELSFT